MKMSFKYLQLSVILLIFSFTACQNQISNQTEQKENSDFLVSGTAWFQQSAEAKAVYLQTYHLSKDILKKNIANSVTKKPKALIVDIDETVLNNSPYEVKCIANGTEYNSETWNEWVMKAEAEALPGAVEFLTYANSLNVDVYYISNRRTSHLEATIKNLIAKGFPQADSVHVLLKDSVSTKEPRRMKVEETHEIIMLFGDNLLDFSTAFEKRPADYGKALIDEQVKLFGTKYIMLPNPMYGSWDDAILDWNKDSTLTNLQKRKAALKGY